MDLALLERHVVQVAARSHAQLDRRLCVSDEQLALREIGSAVGGWWCPPDAQPRVVREEDCTLVLGGVRGARGRREGESGDRAAAQAPVAGNDVALVLVLVRR